MNFALHTDSGNYEGSLYFLERKVSHTIEWEFRSTSSVDLLIIKKTTYEYLHGIAFELYSLGAGNYEILMESFLAEYYVTRGNSTSSGKIEVPSPGLYLIWFLTLGNINYTIKCDPYCFDLRMVFYACLGVATTIGIISYANKFRKLAKLKPISEKEIIMRKYQIKVYCERCGTQLDSDSIFCHECGLKLKNYI